MFAGYPALGRLNSWQRKPRAARRTAESATEAALGWALIPHSRSALASFWPRPLLEEADRLAKRLGVRTRSALVVEALRTLLERVRSEDVDASLDADYGSRTRDETNEERAMVRAFRRSRRRLDLDRERRG